MTAVVMDDLWRAPERQRVVTHDMAVFRGPPRAARATTRVPFTVLCWRPGQGHVEIIFPIGTPVWVSWYPGDTAAHLNFFDHYAAWCDVPWEGIAALVTRGQRAAEKPAKD